MSDTHHTVNGLVETLRTGVPAQHRQQLRVHPAGRRRGDAARQRHALGVGAGVRHGERPLLAGRVAVERRGGCHPSQDMAIGVAIAIKMEFFWQIVDD